MLNGRCVASKDEAGRVFVTTRWSLIASSRDSDGEAEKARAALAELCRTYWRPVYSFVCRRGYSIEDAQDLTQDFFLMVLESQWLSRADESRGRFRSFLLKSLQNFLNHAYEKNHASKRGGNLQFVSWDEWMAEAPSQLSVPSKALDVMPAEVAFDLRWAATVVEHALRRLGEECEVKGRRRLFDALRGHLTSERADTSYRELARTLGVAETVIKKQLHNLRERYRWLLRTEVAQTVADPADIDSEIRHLCAAIVAAGN